MYKITVKGEAKTDHKYLVDLDGIDCEDDFSEYFDENSYSNDVTNGYMRFKLENGILWTITEYDSSRELTQEELEDLKDYTQGQWSDGIGEGFEQEPCAYTDDDEEIYVSPWFFGQEITIIQNKIN